LKPVMAIANGSGLRVDGALNRSAICHQPLAISHG
jgi:hypothetical protein